MLKKTSSGRRSAPASSSSGLAPAVRAALTLSATAFLLSTSGIVFAVSSVSANIGISASVSKACTIGTASPLAFGAYDPIGANATTALTAVGQISVVCSKGASGLTVGMGPGANAVAGQRFMVAPTGNTPLKYDVFQPASAAAGAPCPGTVPWTNAAGVGVLTLTAAPDKTARLYNVCGTIPAGQDVAVDPSYADIVSATLNF